MAPGFDVACFFFCAALVAPRRKFISLEQPHEIRSWTQSLKVTEQQLRAAVAAVGNSADKVREYLGKRT